MSIMTTFSLLIALAGCNDNGVTAFNASPEAAITSHVDGAEVFEGMTVTFRGSASDPDDATATLTTTWYLGTAEACPATLADATGVTSCDIAIGIDDTEVTLEVTDPGAASGSASITLTVVPTDSPDAEIVTPEASGVYYSDQKITFEGVVSDGEDAAEDLIAYWESDIDGLLKDVEAVPNAEGAVDDADYLSEGEHYLTLTAEDTTGKTGSDSVTITVGPPNSGPTCSITAPDDHSAGPEGELVIFEGLVDDVDVPADWLAVAWSSDKDGDLGASTPNSDGTVSFPFSDLSVETHVVTLTATDEIGATCTNSIIYTVSEPPEVEITLPTDGAVLQQGDGVTFTATVSDNEDLPNEVALVWSSDVNGVFSKAGSDSSGSAIAVTYGLSAGPHLVTLLGTDTDGLFSTDTVYITVNEPPVIDSIDITPATGVTTTTTLTCTATGTDPEDGALTPDYTWDNLSTATSLGSGSSLTLTAADASPGDPIACTATIADTDGATAWMSNYVFVENSAPSISSVTITPNPAVAGDSLTCSYSGFSDVDGDADASTFEWFVNGVSEGTTATLATTLVQGDTVECTVTPTDGTDAGTPLSDTLTISNTAPVLSDVSLGPDPAYEDDTLVCTAGSATDIDGSAVTFAYAWAVNGGTIAATSETLTGADFDKNDDVYCTVTPNDGTDDGAAVTSNTVTISNSAPSITDVTIDPNPATASDALTCSWSGFSDADGDTDASTVNWQVNGVDSGITSTVLMSGFVGGDTVTCTVTAFDGTDVGTVLSDTIVVGNTAPTLKSVTITPDPAVASDTLTCTPSGAYDADGDSTTVVYEWTVDGAIMGSTNTLVGLFVAGNLVACRGTISDGTETGTTVTTSITIENTAPEAPVISIIPAAPIAGEDDLVCNVDVASYDVDGDSVTYSFDWEVDGVSYGGTPTTATMSSTIAGTDTTAGETWTCTVTPNDGTDDGASSSASVNIEASCVYGVGEECPGIDCLDILDSGYSTGDGTYWIDPNGTGPFAVFCDMISHGGGWTGLTWPIVDTHLSTGAAFTSLVSASDSGLDPTFGPYTRGDGSDHAYWYTFNFLSGWQQLYFGDDFLIASNACPGGCNSDVYASVWKQEEWDHCYANDPASTGDVGFGDPSSVGPVTSLGDALSYVDTWYEYLETTGWPQGTTVYTNDSEASAFRLSWGEAGADLEGWYPWYSGTIFVRRGAEEPAPEADYTSPSTDYGMNYIPPGTFEMGCTPGQSDCDADESPVHEVTLTNGFYIGVTEVTQGQWQSVMGSNPSVNSACGNNCPVDHVSWEDAVLFANEASDLDGFVAVYDLDGSGNYIFDESADGYRLVTEAEWEYAARCGEDTLYAGSDFIGDVGWWGGLTGSPQEVATKAPNACGLYDMTGSMWEWIWDWYDEDYYSGGDMVDPVGPSTAMGPTPTRVARSGSWSTFDASYTRVSGRHQYYPDIPHIDIGFRLVRTVHTDADEDGVVAAIDCNDDDPDIGEDCPTVGDIGPGGGLVFYDKGVYSDGWRFMEGFINPMNSDFPSDWQNWTCWGCDGTSIVGADNELIGAGYQNTQDILATCGEADIGAMRALNFESEGFSDWFLPSSGELESFFVNLAAAGFNMEVMNVGAPISSTEVSSTHIYAAAWHLGIHERPKYDCSFTWIPVRYF